MARTSFTPKICLFLLVVASLALMFTIAVLPFRSLVTASFQILDKEKQVEGRAESSLVLAAVKTVAPTTRQGVVTDTNTTTTTSSTSEEDHDAFIKARFASRLQNLRTACKRYADKPSVFWKHKLETLTLENYPPAMNVSVAYCPIQKVSSTTWREIFRAIDKLRKTGGNRAGPPMGKRDVVFAFTREPYGRLLSAYFDKLFVPNPWFWGYRGRYMVDKFRVNASSLSLKSGHDVTFPEFIKFFISMQTTGVKRDDHLTPIHDHCQFCHQPYKYIGHLETIKEDMPFLLKTMRSPVHYNKTFDNVTIASDCMWALTKMRQGVKECMGLDEASRRLWKHWQVRGLISKHIAFPLQKEDTRDIQTQTLANAAVKALARSGDVKWQRTEALREAFASVPLADRLQVKKLLAVDFEMFGFDSEPDEIFPRKPYTPDPNFSYFDPYN